MFPLPNERNSRCKAGTNTRSLTVNGFKVALVPQSSQLELPKLCFSVGFAPY